MSYRFILAFLAVYAIAFLVISIIPAGASPPSIKPAATKASKPVETPEVFFADESSKRVKKFKALFDAHELKIYREMRTLNDHPWAGQYYRGEDQTESLTISPDSGASYALRGCNPRPADLNYGNVTFDGQYLQIKWQLETHDKPWFSAKLLIVPWGERRYLVPTGEILGFCRDVNENLKAQTRSFGYNAWHRDDSKMEVSGQPQLPAAYEKYRNMESLRGSIKEAGPITMVSEYGSSRNLTKRMAQKVLLDIGEADAVLPQMRFRLTEEKSSYGWITITDVRKNEADAIAQFNLKDGEPVQIMEVGNKVILIH